MKNRFAIFGIILGFAFLGASSLFAKGAQSYNLGPTGLVGTVSKNSIKVSEVHKGSPADGKIKKGDQIIGTGNGKFRKDVRAELATAIDEVETEKAGGKLTLVLKGNKKVDLQLKVLGRYSDTAPFKCTKSDAIIKQAADYLAKQINDSLSADSKKHKKGGGFNSGATHSAILGLMATGEKKYIDLVKKYMKQAPWVTNPPSQEDMDALLKGDKDMGYVGWYWGYNLITLGEYYLLTGDKSVLPAIERYSVSLARGGDAGGLWGHRMATVKRNGRLPGYSHMNQSCLSSFMGLLFAEKCGIKDPRLLKGIDKAHKYFSSYTGKGGFPYGVHGPQSSAYNNNGMSGSAAVCMNIKGDKEGTKFFSQLSATAYDNLEQGHASNFFNPLWTPLGANLSGPEVSHQFFKNSLKFHTLYRNWDGSFSRYGKEGGKEGSQTGVALLTYCMPRKAILITGKDSDQSLYVKGAEATKIVGRSKFDYKSQSVDELLAMFGNPIPHVTRAAVWTLREKEGNFIPKLVEMMEKGNKIEKMSAIGYFGYKCPPEQALPQIERIGAILKNKNEDPEVRATAAYALAWQGEKAYKYLNDMCQLIVEDEPNDYFREIDIGVGKSINILCGTPFKTGIVSDKTLYYKAASKLMDHKRQHGRSEGVKMISDMPIEDFHIMAEKIMHIVEDKDPTYHSYHSWQSTIGPAIGILADLNIKEGLPHAAGVLEREGGKFGFKVRMLCATLPKYGGNAKEALQKIKKLKSVENIQKGRFKGMWNKMVKTIEEDKNAKKLITFEEAMKAGEK